MDHQDAFRWLVDRRLLMERRHDLLNTISATRMDDTLRQTRRNDAMTTRDRTGYGRRVSVYVGLADLADFGFR